MIVHEIKCDICKRVIVYNTSILLSAIKVKIASFKEVHICNDCKKEIKERILKGAEENEK